VARELGLSDRTLQRRIIDDGATFRQLLLEVRQELAHEYLNRPEMRSNLARCHQALSAPYLADILP
jgi:AraC-like DNA-binding protein